MNKDQPNNPLHGITLEAIVRSLQEQYGWDGLARKIHVNCFKNDPSVKSSLKFLRKTPWAREQVEALYLSSLRTGSPWNEAMTNFQASKRQSDPDGESQS